MKKLFALKARHKMSKLLALAMLININVGWVSIFASESPDDFLQDQELVLENDAYTVKYFKPGQNIAQSPQAPVAKPASAKPAAASEILALRQEDIRILLQLTKLLTGVACQDVKSGDATMLTLIRSLVEKLNINLGSPSLQKKAVTEDTVFLLLEGLKKSIGERLNFSASANDSIVGGRTIYEFLQRILDAVSQLHNESNGPDAQVTNLLRIIAQRVNELRIDLDDKIGSKIDFPPTFDEPGSTGEKTVFEFLEKILERMNLLECATQEEILKVVKEQNEKLSANIDRQTADLTSKIEKIENLIGKKTAFPADCHDDKATKNTMEFLKEILERVCGIECASEEEIMNLLSEKFEHADSKFEALIGSKETFPTECRESNSVYHKPCKLECKKDKPCHEKDCKFDAQPLELSAELGGSDASYNRAQKYNEKLSLQKYNVTQFLKEILRRICLIDAASESEVREITCENSERLKNCLMQAIEHADNEVLKKLGKSLSFPECALGDGAHDGKSKSLFEFSREILERICQLEESTSSLDCVKEDEVRKIIDSKIDQVVGHEAAFPEECDISDNTQKTLFDFSKEILRRLCILECEVSSSSSSSSSSSDAFATCNDCFVTIFTKLDECCESLNSKADVLQSSLDACCSTVNSKVDALDSSLDECCFTLSSKADLLQSDLDECCFTLGSKNDVLQNSVDTLNSSVDTLNSANAVLQNFLTICCMNLTSKLDVLLTSTCFSHC